MALITNQSTLPLHTLAGAAEEVATTIVAAHTHRPAHEISAAEAQPLTDKILHTHTIEPEQIDPTHTAEDIGCPISIGVSPD